MARGVPHLALHAGRAVPRGRTAGVFPREAPDGDGAGGGNAASGSHRRAARGPRGAALAPAAAWLRRYTDVSEIWREAQCAGWLARAERAAQAQPFDHLRESEAGILAALQRIAGRIEGADWRVAICHGDFHPNNLLVSGKRLTGSTPGPRGGCRS
ncbi:MAG: phosphotransferase [Roseovarius sp.]|nr:phosphotransferase [Roseovarius sp.]